MYYIGFVVDGKVPTFYNCLKQRAPQALVYGWGGTTAISVMRFRWIAEYVNKTDCGVRYELYRPWRRYQAVVFLKSMCDDSIELMYRLQNAGVRTVFDVNVDYLSPSEGTFFYEGMAPSLSQRTAAITMIKGVDGVIGDSLHIRDVAKQYAQNVITIEDNVENRLIQTKSSWLPSGSEKLTLLWSGQAIKLFELLAIKNLLLAWKDRIHLKCITNSLSALENWYPGYKVEMEELLQQLSHEFIPFTSISSLMHHYDNGGIFISPRFLNNSYNLGHTEWKITLPMARGRMVLCSPQRSYERVHSLAKGRGIRVCGDEKAWHRAFSELFSASVDWHGEQTAAISVVRDHYSTESIALRHLDFVTQIVHGGEI